MSAASDDTTDMAQGGGDAALPHAPATAVFYDGTSNRKRSVTLQFRDALEIEEDGAVVASWPYHEIRRADGTRALRLSCLSAPSLARLEIADKDAAERVIARCGNLDAGAGTQTWRIVGWSLAAACSIVLITLYAIPLIADRLAPMVPVAVENRIGEAVDRQVRTILGGQVCTRPDGQAAFAKLVGKLKDAGQMNGTLDARVLSTTMANAVALPGGKVYLLDGLLQKSNDVDEIAGVLAHELGHAHHRDGLRRIIQTGGTSFLIGLLLGDVAGGGAVLIAAQSMINASYSREAETRADTFAIDSMRALGRSPRPLGELLVRMTGGGRFSTVIDSHPLSADRLDRMKKADPAEKGEPILTAQEWQALKRICDDVRKAPKKGAGAAPVAAPKTAARTAL